MLNYHLSDILLYETEMGYPINYFNEQSPTAVQLGFNKYEPSIFQLNRWF